MRIYNYIYMFTHVFNTDPTATLQVKHHTKHKA
jgi:hypothetical protein